jgi:hypothetical protein
VKLPTTSGAGLCWKTDEEKRNGLRRFVESLENDLTIRAKTTEVAIKDFTATSYATIFEEEVQFSIYWHMFCWVFIYQELTNITQDSQVYLTGVGEQLLDLCN